MQPALVVQDPKQIEGQYPYNLPLSLLLLASLASSRSTPLFLPQEASVSVDLQFPHDPSSCSAYINIKDTSAREKVIRISGYG